MLNKKGLTLIELVIVLALIGILSSLLFFPILFSFTNFEKQSQNVNEMTTARATMELLTKEIRRSESVSFENDKLILDTATYSFKDNALYKGDTQLIFGHIYKLEFIDTGYKNETKISVEIKKNNGEIYKLASIVSFR